MIRTQIYLTEAEKEAIDKLSDERNTSRSDIIREAIDEYVSRKKSAKKKKAETIMDYAGIWKEKKDTPDVRILRKGWDSRANRSETDNNDR